MSNTKKNAAAAKIAAAAKTNTNAANTNGNTTNNSHADLSAVDVVALSASWIKEYNTISNIRANYAALVEQYGKKNFDAVLKNAKTIRATEIENAAAVLNSDVFTFSGISAAVFAAVAKSAGYAELCKFARREYAGTDAERAAAVIRDYYTNVDTSGAPLCKVHYINAAGTEIRTTFERRALTHSNAVSILKTSLDNMGRAAKNAATRTNGNDNAAATRDNVRAVGVVIAVYAAAVDENGRATLGERRDTSKDERTKKNAAAVVGRPLSVGCVTLAIWNAAAAGNDDAADAVDAARNAAKDAAARRSNK